MTEENVLPMDGGEFEDDPELRDRLIASYRNTPAPADGAMARCIHAVLDRARDDRKRAVVAPASPAFARRHWFIAASAVAAAMLVTVTVRSRPPIGEPATPANAEPVSPVASTTEIAGGVQFDIRLPRDFAANVSLVGDFNGWNATATPMVKDPTGGWSAKVTLLPGRHVYAYLVNGEQWVVDPLAPQIPDAGYGPANAVVVEGDTK